MKKKILFINTVSGFNATGNITANLASIDGFESLVCYGRKRNYRKDVNTYKIGSLVDNCVAAFETIFLDNNLNVCRRSTLRLIEKIKEYNPDIIHLHNLHGYYISFSELFAFLKEYNKPVIWTLHDCWAITGYCCHFDGIGCKKYKDKCTCCPQPFSYPFSLFKQNVEEEHEEKVFLINSINNLTIVTPSKWLKEKVDESRICKETVVINNGITIIEKKPTEKVKKDVFRILAVASVWSRKKGLYELAKIAPLLDEKIELTIVGKIDRIPRELKRCNLVRRTSDYLELVDLYNQSDLFINATLEDTYPTVNLESLSCGTPVLTYNTGGSPEPINSSNGIVVKKGDYLNFAETINKLSKEYPFNSEEIRNKAKKFDKKYMIEKYEDLYKSVLVKK